MNRLYIGDALVALSLGTAWHGLSAPVACAALNRRKEAASRVTIPLLATTIRTEAVLLIASSKRCQKNPAWYHKPQGAHAFSLVVLRGDVALSSSRIASPERERAWQPRTIILPANKPVSWAYRQPDSGDDGRPER